MTAAKADVEELMNAWAPLARTMLHDHGEFHPYGAIMKRGGEIVAVSGLADDDMPPSADLIELIKDGLRAQAASGDCLATALFYDVRIGTGDGGSTDAIAVALDHADDYSVTVFLHYEMRDGTPVFGDVTASEGADDIFAR